MALTTVRLLAQQFRLVAEQSGSGSIGTVITNWEEVDTSYDKIGNVWSQSSGIFSCANTGIYLCSWALVVNDNTGGDRFDPAIEISTDSGSNFNTRSLAWGHADPSSAPKDVTVNNQFMFDVTNTTTFRLQFVQSTSNNVSSTSTIVGNTNYTATNILFIRLGDT